jgi:porphyrinogen peroxidase
MPRCCSCARKGGRDGGERDPDGNGSVAEVTRSQPVLTPLTESAIFLVLTVETGGADAVRDLLADSGIVRSVGSAIGTASCPVSSGSGRTRGTCFAGSRPAELHPFREICQPSACRRAHAGRPAVSYPRSPDGSLLRTGRAAGGAAARRGRRCRRATRIQVLRRAGPDGLPRRLENPTGAPALLAATVGDDDLEFTGGSYVIVQK